MPVRARTHTSTHTHGVLAVANNMPAKNKQKIQIVYKSETFLRKQ